MPVEPAPLPDVRFFVDADLLGVGKALAVVRKDVVHPGHRRCPEIRPQTPDSVWLPIVGDAGWIAISRNKRIRYNPGREPTTPSAWCPSDLPDRWPEHDVVGPPRSLGSALGSHRGKRQ